MALDLNMVKAQQPHINLDAKFPILTEREREAHIHFDGTISLPNCFISELSERTHNVHVHLGMACELNIPCAIYWFRYTR